MDLEMVFWIFSCMVSIFVSKTFVEKRSHSCSAVLQTCSTSQKFLLSIFGKISGERLFETSAKFCFFLDPNISFRVTEQFNIAKHSKTKDSLT